MKATPLISVIIPNWNGADIIGISLDSLRHQTYPNMETIVVDGNSQDNSVAFIREHYPKVQVIDLPDNRGFAGNVNAGIQATKGDIIVLFNNDAEAEPDFITQLLKGFNDDPQVGSVAAKVLDYEQRDLIGSAGDELCINGMAHQRANGHKDNQDEDLTYIFGATASAAAYRRDLFEDIGLFDETFFAYMEDVDFALRAQMAGWKCTYYPPARAYHMVSATGGGKFASYHVARNTIYLIAKNFPLALFQKAFGRIVGAQSQRFFDALKHWRGEAARATMYGVLMGILTAPRMVGKRRHIMQKRTLSDEDMFALLAQYCD